MNRIFTLYKRALQFVATSILLLFILCVNRDGPIHPRDNPWDSGGENWISNIIPSISGKAETIWYDYNHSAGNGSVKITFSMNDQNLPYDTLHCGIFIIDSAELSRQIIAENDSVAIVGALTPSATYRCSLYVTDSKDFNDTVITISTPLQPPPLPPSPILDTDNAAIRLMWVAVDNATDYVIYAATNRAGPFSPISTVVQPSEGTGSEVSFTDNIDQYSFRFYLVASENSQGQCRSRDTLYGHPVSDEIDIPSIISVSQGTSSDYIRITWQVDDTALHHFIIYRAIGEKGIFRMIADVTDSSSLHSFNDVPATLHPCCYRIAAIDQLGRMGWPGEPSCGFVRNTTTSQINLTIRGYTDHLALSWSNVPEISSYVVYRSDKDCSTGSTPIATVTIPSYNDYLTSPTEYYYHVSAVNSAGYETAMSACVTGILGLLPAPTGIRISAASSVVLSWDTLRGAAAYEVYRSSVSCPNADTVFITTTSNYFNDTTVTAGYYFYAVAAVDSTSRRGLVSACYRAEIVPFDAPENVTASFGVHEDVVMLEWDALPGAATYRIYRSLRSCTSDIDSIGETPDPSYSDSVPTSDIFYYRIAGVTVTGFEGPFSECVEGRVYHLPAPENVHASQGLYSNRIRISWDAVTGANGYVVFKGTSNIASKSVPIDTVTSLFSFDSVDNTGLYYYWVAARNRLGSGAHSSYVYGRILYPPVLATVSDTGAITLTWTVDTSVRQIDIYRSGNGWDFLSTATGQSYRDTPPDHDAYAYQIVVKTVTGDSSFSYDVMACKRLPPPTGVTAIDSADGVYLKWNSVPGSAYYHVYRSVSPGDSLYYRETSDTFYFSESSTAKQYYYRIAAINEFQIGLLSEDVKTPVDP